VANKEFCRLCRQIPHIWRNGRCWTNWSVAEIPRFTKSISTCNNTESCLERSITYFSKLCCNYSEVRGIEWIVGGISKWCSELAKQTTTNTDIECGSWWLWAPRDSSPSTLWSGQTESFVPLDLLTQHHTIDELPDSGVMLWPCRMTDSQWRHVAVRWVINLHF
jgi:hypothetical protein